jgi:hypothetical protein
MQRLPGYAALVFLALATGSSIVEAQPAPPPASEIFDRARAAVQARPLPPYIAYTQFVSLERHGRSRAQNERVVVRSADGATYVTSLDDPRAAAHVEPRPLVFPTSTFGLVQRPAGETASAALEGAAAGEPADTTAPRVIGRVSATSRAYDLHFAGTDQIDGTPLYHLIAVPRFDPRRNRIRALYVDPATFEPRRIVYEYFAERGPLRSRPTVTVDYEPVGDSWVISHAALDFVVRFGFFTYGGSGELRISEVSFPAAEPAWMFDRAALAAHQHAAASQ